MVIKAVIFDMDGTMIDNLSFHVNAWIQFLTKYNIATDKNGFEKEIYGTAREMLTRLFRKEFSDEEVKKLADEKESIYRELYKSELQEVKGLTSLLKRFDEQGIKIGLATMSNQENIKFILESLDIKNYFNVTVAADEISKGKPDPEIFNLTLKKLNVDKHDCIVFEDSASGVQAAVNAKIKVVGVCTTSSAEQLKSLGCIMTIKNFTEFEF